MAEQLPTARYRALIDAAARLVGLPRWESSAPGAWLEALILNESSGNPRAMRYEAHQDRAGRADASSDGDQPGVDDGFLEDDRSYGLMQVMGSNIRRLVGVPPGTPLRFEWSLLPLANLSLGLRVLVAELATTGGDVDRALARYNGGPTGDDVGAGGEMRCAGYVRRVRCALDKVEQDRSLA